MARKAILIDAGGVKGSKGYLPGPAADVESLRAFLDHAVGGWWSKSEIVPLQSPSRSQLLKEISNSQSVDYCIVLASGHGHHVQGRGIDETRFCCNADEEVSAGELNPGCSRATVILDCCRHVTRLEELIEAQLSNRMMKSFASRKEGRDYRAAYNAAIAAAERGCSYVYSCNLNEAAQETANGGYYTQALLQCSYNWHGSGASGIYDLWDVHHAAARVVNNRERQQNPQENLGSRQKWFPFAVNP